MKEISIEIQSAVGLHARPASVFVKKALSFSSSVTVTKGARSVDGKSILGILSLGAHCGEQITIRTDGPDEEDAMACMLEVIRLGDNA